MTRRMAERASIAEATLSIAGAGIENLVSCPRCPYVEIHDEPQELIACMNKKCGAVTCTLCLKDVHVGQDCPRDNELEKRKAYEEEQTMKSVVQCPKCTVAIYKDGGCNKVKCTCGISVCYLCRKDISLEKYMHFSDSYDKGCLLFDMDDQEQDHDYYDPSSSEEDTEDEKERRDIQQILQLQDGLERFMEMARPGGEYARRWQRNNRGF
jgi:hypothetical protein